MQVSIIRPYATFVCVAMIMVCRYRQDVAACDKAVPRNVTVVPSQRRPTTTKMALVGWIDLDDDGISDRELIREHLAATGASIDIEVDDNGVKRPKNRKIDSQTSLLVVGSLVDPTTITDPAKRKIAERVAQHYQNMRAEARKAGVRTVFIHDFLSYGRNKKRLWRPSMSGSKMKLTGPTSGIYQRSKRLNQPKSTGTTSKLFRDGSPYDD